MRIYLTCSVALGAFAVALTEILGAAHALTRPALIAAWILFVCVLLSRKKPSFDRPGPVDDEVCGTLLKVPPFRSSRRAGGTTRPPGPMIWAKSQHPARCRFSTEISAPRSIDGWKACATLAQVWTDTIIPAGKISSTLACRWAMP